MGTGLTPLEPFGDGLDDDRDDADDSPSSGRDAAGRFVRGNPGGPGNPRAGDVARRRAAMLNAVNEDDIREIFAALLVQAKAGNIAAAREVLDRTLGKPAHAPEISNDELPIPFMSETDLKHYVITRVAQIRAERGQSTPPPLSSDE